jgi:O-antigen ligase
MNASLTARHAAATPVKPQPIRPAATITVILMMIAAPIVHWQGPVHTTVMDPIIILFLGLYWGRMIAQRDTLPLPLLGAFWAIIAGSLIGLIWSSDATISMLVLAQDLYLYLWFVTTVHFFAYRLRMDVVAIAYVVVACTIGLMGAADLYAHVLGGLFTAVQRSTGTFENPNMFGNYLNIGLFLAWSVGKGGKPIMYLAIPILLVCILATGSNGALLSIIVAAAAVVAAYPSRKWAERIGILLVVAALGLAILGNWTDRWTDAVMSRMSQGRSAVGGSVARSAEERIPLWLDAIDSFEHFPLGVGPANFNRLGGTISRDYHGPHNEYVGMLVERGPLGLGGWVGMLVCLALGVHAARSMSSAMPLAIEPLYGVVAVIATHAGTMEVFHFRHVWMAFAVVAASTFQAQLLKRSALPSATVVREAA